jgi:hypothetical protein
VDDELERMWKEAVVAFQACLEEMTKTTTNFRQNIRSKGRDFNPRPPEYEPAALNVVLVGFYYCRSVDICHFQLFFYTVRVAQSVQCLATGWMTG